MVFYAAFNSISVLSRRQLTLLMSFWVSPVLGWGSEVSCPRTLPRKEPRGSNAARTQVPRLRVKHFTIEQHRTPVRIGENAGNQHFLLFPQCFLPYQKKIAIKATLELSSANAFNLDNGQRRKFVVWYKVKFIGH